MVLLTGATGFLGSHLLLELISRGKKVRAFLRDKKKIVRIKALCSIYGFDFSQVERNTEWFEGNLTNFQDIFRSIEGVKEVYHTAAKVSMLSRNEQSFWNVNVKSTEVLVNAALDNSIEKFCYISSIAALGSSPQGVVNEETYANPEEKKSLYSKTKYYGEMEVWRGIEEGLNAVIVNPSYIIGVSANCKGNGCIFFNLVNKGLKYSTSGKLGFVDVRDVAYLAVELMERSIFGERFILSAQDISFTNILQWTAQALGKDINFKELSATSVKAFSYLFSFLSFLGIMRNPLTPAVIENLFLQESYSNKKILGALPNFKFRNIKDTIFELGQYFRSISK